ncbi:MAG: hypothetical protein JRJ41_03665 [Deltaproteobacteria bacterium]|jgi:hypothetical protein|nr:hypothetical protein [Deltaproteobacteria bacterium]
MDIDGDQWVKQFQTVTIKIKDGTIITGKLNIGDYPRVSDLFKQSPDQYLVLADAEHRGSSGKVVIVNKSEIVWVEPED